MRVDVNGVGIEVHDEGAGPAVLLLHGFPDSHRMWRHQVDSLTAAGFRTIAPDLRGFGASDRPDGVDQYSMLFSAGDVIAVLDTLGVERAHVVGHDWGAALAWVVASFSPDRVDHLAVLSVGHPASFGTAGLIQREKSWYMLLFQFEGVAEEWLSADGWANFEEWAHHPDHEEVTAALERPGALTASLNWYRANVPASALVAPPLALPPVAAPTMGVWSSGDMALTEEQMTGSAAHVTGPWRYERIEGAGHWIPLERADEVSALLLDFLPDPRVILAALAVVAAVDWWAVWTRRRAVEIVAKPATAALLVALAATVGDADGAVRAALVVAAVCGLAGDVALLGRGGTAFMAGLGAFAVGHTAYSVAAVAGGVSWRRALLAVPFLVVLLGYRFAAETVPGARRQGGTAMAGAVVFYAAVISTMVLTATGSGSWWAALGAVLFAVSDWVLGLDRFAHPLPHGRIVVIVSYHIGQALLILGLSGA